jgi:sugar phosphate isomerase/epimerase
MPEMTRRQFVTQASLLAALGSRGVAYATDPIGRTRPSHLKLSLAAYSYRDYLSGPKKTMDLFGFLELAADLGLDAVEPTSYYFPEDVSTGYLHRMKQRAFLLGLDVSGTAVMNDFCLPPGPERDKNVAHVRDWIGHAAELDAPTLRILSGNWIQGTPDKELARRVIATIDELTPLAVERGVTLALENHGGGVTTTDEELLSVVRAVKGPNFAVNLDTGNFHGEDPYAQGDCAILGNLS